MANRPQTGKQTQDPFLTPVVLDRKQTSTPRPSGVARVIGASCGAFSFCFAAILITLPLLLKFGQPAASLIWLVAMILGAVGGAAFPRIGQFLGYAFIIFVNVMLSVTIGRNLGEQVTLFAIFAFVELIFFMSRNVTKTN